MGRYDKKDSRLNFLPYENHHKEHILLMRKNVLPLLTEEPKKGENTIIVGHDDLFEAVTGIYPEPQGIAYVIKPKGSNSIEILGSLLPEEWAQQE